MKTLIMLSIIVLLGSPSIEAKDTTMLEVIQTLLDGSPLELTYEGNDYAISINDSNPKRLHALQDFCYALTVYLSTKYQIDFSISAYYERIPLARYIYNAQFDTITPVIMWH